MMVNSWNEVDFTNGFYNLNIDRISNEYENTIKRALITIGMALLILAGTLIVAVTAVQFYTVYTQDKQVKAAIQMAKDENRQICINTNNKYKMTLNVTHSSSLSLAGDSAGVTSVSVYPKGYYGERIVLPNGSVITPY